MALPLANSASHFSTAHAGAGWRAAGRALEGQHAARFPCGVGACSALEGVAHDHVEQRGGAEAAGGRLLGHGGEQRRVDAHRAVGRGGGGVGEGAGHRGARAEHVGLHVLLDRGDAHAVAEVAERLG